MSDGGRRLLGAVGWVVPPEDRAEWQRGWRAELWAAPRTRRLWAGVVCDAGWLRWESWRRASDGTAALCLAALAGAAAGLLLLGLAVSGDWTPGRVVAAEFGRSLFAAPLVVFVGFATASRRHEELGRGGSRWRRGGFLAAKLLLAMTVSCLLSADLCLPLRAVLPVTAAYAQMLCFVLAALVGQRWAFDDQERRCKQCLRALARPAKVGRPSRNLLEWNGTELRCREGHGLLSVPEMETSWCQASVWVEGLRGVR